MRRQDGKLHAPAGEKGIIADENVGPFARERCERRIVPEAADPLTGICHFE
jgi:hypothetical protein